MKLLIAKASVLAIPLFLAQGDDGVLLRRQLVEGEKTSYQITVTSKQNISNEAMGMPEQNMTFTFNSRYSATVGKLSEDKSKAPITLLVDQIKVESDNPMGMNAMGGDLPKEIKGAAVMDTLGRITEIKFDDSRMTRMAAMSGGSQLSTLASGLTFPEKSIKVGDTWQMTLPKSPTMGDKEIVLTAKLVGEKMVGGVAAWEISVSGKFPLTVDLSKAMQASGNDQMPQMKMTMTGTADMNNTFQIEKATGKLLAGSGTTKTDSKLNLEEMGATIDIKGQTEVKLTLLPQTPAK